MQNALCESLDNSIGDSIVPLPRRNMQHVVSASDLNKNNKWFIFSILNKTITDILKTLYCQLLDGVILKENKQGLLDSYLCVSSF